MRIRKVGGKWNPVEFPQNPAEFPQNPAEFPQNPVEFSHLFWYYVQP